MKIPHIVIIVSALFMGYIVYLVYKTMQSPVDLISTEYYKEEIAYQDRIEEIKNTAELKGNVVLSFQDADKKIVISFPDSSSEITGEILLQRPSEIGIDKNLKLSTLTGKAFLPVLDLKKGLWNVKISWRQGKKAFYYETPLVIP